MHRVEWIASPANEPSLNVARRLGMTREGVLRESYLYRGVRSDMEVWSVLAPEWRAARARHGR
jgi:ribosomal-protein-serine acetyltransferase